MPSLGVKIVAALCTGTIGICVANPTDVVKIRLQSQFRNPDPNAKKLKGSIDTYRTILRTDGIRGLWLGIIPNILRNSIINAAEIAAYDQYKEWFLKFTKFPDNIALHFVCGFLAGFTATCVGSPFDVVKTRMMSKIVPYNGVLDCVFKTLRHDGPFAFYNGFVANFMRIGTWNIVMFVVYEQIKDYVFPAPVEKKD